MTATVSHVLSTISRSGGGISECIRSLCEQQRQSNNVHIHSVSDRYTAEDIDRWRSLDVHVARRVGPRFAAYSPALAKSLSGVRPDIVQLHGLWTYPSLATRAYCSKHTVPMLASPHGMLDPWALRQSRWKKGIAAFIFEKSNVLGASCIHALTSAETIASRAYGYSGPIAEIPNGVDLPNSSELEALPVPDWDRLDTRKTLLFLGRLTPKKGVSELIQSWGNMLRQKSTVSTDWKLIIAGWGDSSYTEQLKTLITDLAVADDVKLVGPVYGEKKQAALNNASAFVLPSYSEGLPMSVLEAWSFGKPAFITEACNLECGFASGAAVRIELNAGRLIADWGLLEDKDFMHAAGSRGIDVVTQHFSWTNVSKKFDKLYQWMLGGGDSPEFVKLI